jgi:hypothetical protein
MHTLTHYQFESFDFKSSNDELLENGINGILLLSLPCLVVAEGNIYAHGEESPLEYLGFCRSKVVVTSRNLESKPNLKKWSKQASANRFVPLPPSCLEVVYLLYVGPFNN